jgi:hypothetical protein
MDVKVSGSVIRVQVPCSLAEFLLALTGVPGREHDVTGTHDRCFRSDGELAETVPTATSSIPLKRNAGAPTRANAIRHHRAKAGVDACRRAQRSRVSRPLPVSSIWTVGRPRCAMGCSSREDLHLTERAPTTEIPGSRDFPGEQADSTPGACLHQIGAGRGLSLGPESLSLQASRSIARVPDPDWPKCRAGLQPGPRL